MTDPEGRSAAGAGEAAQLLALVDRLGVLLEENDLAELEVESGPTRVILRRADIVAPRADVAYQPPASSPAPADAGAGAAPGVDPDAELADRAGPRTVSVIAPLTGIFYGSPAPGSAPYVQAGGEVAVGQVIGLIEAMKLFNEIKSDVAGRVVRLVAETGALVKAKQPLLEVEPL